MRFFKFKDSDWNKVAVPIIAVIIFAVLFVILAKYVFNAI